MGVRDASVREAVPRERKQREEHDGGNESLDTGHENIFCRRGGKESRSRLV